MSQLKISGYYNPPKGDYDAMHSFESRTKDGFGGKMHTIVSKALKDFYQSYKLNPTITSINILMDDINWTVKWEVLIDASTDGKAYIGLTSRGGAGPKNGPNGAVSRARIQADIKIKALPLEVNPKTTSKELFDFNFQSKGTTYIRQIFILYTNPSSFPPQTSIITKSGGVVVNSETNESIKGATIKNDNTSPPSNFPLGDGGNTNSTPIITPQPTETSNIEGDFTIGLLPTNPPQSIPNQTYTKPEPIIISAPGYESLNIIPYKGDGTPKENLGVIQLQQKTTSVEDDKITSSQLTESQIELQSASKKDFKYYSQKKLNDSIINIKNKLIPVIITLIAEIGVVGVQKLIEQGKIQITDIEDQISCPTQPELIQIINRKNKLVKQLNNSLKVIDSTIKALGVSGGVIESLNITFQVLKNLPIPSSVPPGVGIPINVILGIQDNKDKLDKLIKGLRTMNIGTLTTLILLRQVLSQALQYLNMLDKLVQHCYPDADQEQISAELTALTQQQTQQLSPIVININGFEMGVETEPTTNLLKRRRAIARNKGGVVMLKGEWSFSSIDQILIDELVFYIQQNNLKAD